MFCEKCGVKQPDNAVFCSSCGNQMGNKSAGQPKAKPVQPKPVAPRPVAPQPVKPAAPAPQVAPRQVPQAAPQAVPPRQVPQQQAVPPQAQRPVAQPVYQQPQAQPQRLDPLTQPLSVGGYMGMFLLMAIPFVNFIMMLIWLFGSNTNKNKKNFAIAMVLFTIIMIVLSFLLSGIIGAILYPLLQDMQYNVY